MIKAIFKAVLAIAALALGGLALWCLWDDHGTHIGLLAGLGFGILLGPARIAGVDFRQWFRNPNAPSELGDDTFIGLVRSGFHLLWGSALLALVALSFTACKWVPYSCAPFSASALLFFWEILWSAIKVGVFGIIPGVALVQGIVETVWRCGLAFRLPPPRRTVEYLAMQELPYLPKKKPEAGRRRLIVCCDGTWNWPEPDLESNIVRLVRALAPQVTTAQGETIPQIVHYHQGVGTGNFIDRVVGGGAGVGAAASVKACYGFLVDNYKPGDEIFLFGFSRGAYVARSLGGAISALGMMRKEDMGRFAEMWNWYWQDRLKRDPATLEQIAPDRYKDVEIECVGVWDTVGALGIPGSRFCGNSFAFHETQLGPRVRHAFQALAMDEQRGNFQGAIWVPSGTSAESEKNARAGGPRQVLKQMWFPGVHSNIGGGYKKHGLSDAAFLWMLSQIADNGLLEFHEPSILRALDRDPEIFPVGTLADSRTRFWKILGSPIPRPVCVVSETEQIHESASLRAGVVKARRDKYREPARGDWVKAMQQPLPARPKQAIFEPRAPYESRLGGSPRPKPIVPTKIEKKLDLCSWLLEKVSARG